MRGDAARADPRGTRQVRLVMSKLQREGAANAAGQDKPEIVD